MLFPRFVRAYPPATPTLDDATSALWLPFRESQPLLPAAPADAGRAALFRGGSHPPDGLPLLGEPLLLGTLDGLPCFACEVAGPDEAAEPEADQVAPSDELAGSPNGIRWRRVGLRALFGMVDEAEYTLAGYATQLLHWRRVSRFCPACGQPTDPVENTWGRKCVACGHTAYPHVSPAVLVLVHDGHDRVLLASKSGWGTRYSILAGFVEPGESLEECAAREVFEEAGVPVADLEYAGSQPWPFPHQVMVGFFARFAGDHRPTQADLRLDETELARADWFRAGALPDLPPPLSLSRQMIDRWAARLWGRRAKTARP
jgi:NAD+ diphosphatase